MRVSDWIQLAVLGIVFVPAWLDLAAVWSSVDYYSHGYLVPLVALWAASARRHELPRLPVERSPIGLGVLALALGLHVIGAAAALVWISGLAIVLAVAGAILYWRGLAWLRSLSFAVGYLVFMIPLPGALVTPLIVNLQLFVSTVGVALVRAMGLVVHQQGNVIQIPGGDELFVAEACSGITSILTLIPLGVILAYFTERRTWKRCLLVATVVPVAMFGNLVRVVATVFAARSYGARFATESALHEWVGLGTYVLACLVLLGVGSLLRSPGRTVTPDAAAG